MAFKIPNFYAQNKKSAFAKGPEASSVPSPLNVSYDKAYDDLSDAEKAKYRKSDKAGDGKGRARFKEKAKADNKKEYGTTEPTKAAQDGKLSDAQTKKLIVSKLKRDKTAEETKKAKKDKPAETTTTSNNSSSDSKDSKEIKVKTRKEKRSARRADRLKAKAKSKGSLTPGQKKRLERNEAKAKGEKPEKTKVGKALKSVVDKAKDLVSKDSPAQIKKSRSAKKYKKPQGSFRQRNEGESHPAYLAKKAEARRKMDKNKEQK